MSERPSLRPRDRDTILQALSAGVVPRTGLAHIQVGRAGEVTALVRDIDRIADAGSAVRFVIGEYGAGKTFFLNLVRLIALERKLVTIHADLAPDRRIHATGGQARGLYAEAVRNMATRTKPDGGALPSVVERFITDCVRQAETDGLAVETVIDRRLTALQEHVGGYDFATVLKAYWRGSEAGDEASKAAALRWLRGEYSTKTEARQALGVRNIIDDDDVYDSLKLLAAFVRLAGYAGLLVVFDEMVNLYKLQSAQARNQNFEQILRIVNDVLQLNIVFESDVAINETVKVYFANLKENGLAFDGANSAKYEPLTKEQFANTLGTIEYKTKTSRMLQIADSYIYAIARQKYDRGFGVFRHLRDTRRIINFALEDAERIKAMGIKYYCY